MNLLRKTFLFAFMLLAVSNLMAQTVKGVIIDKETKESLIGVAVLVQGTSNGYATDEDGSYIIKNVSEGSLLEISYFSYKTVVSAPVNYGGAKEVVMNFELESDSFTLGSVMVTARKDLEGEKVLRTERMNASHAIENLGAKEMSIKGVSNVEDGVKKITGVSVASGQLFVRGLGDRYSLTTLNGLPIASPNPDNKLIPLDLFPSSIVKNITVSKVYQASSFADYSGAHIDISTKDNVGKDFFTVSANLGGTAGTIFNDFYVSDRASLLSANYLSDEVRNMQPSDFNEYVKSNDPFGTTFSVSKKTALPDFGVGLSMGKMWKVKDNNELNMLVSLSGSNESTTMLDCFVKELTAQGTTLSEFAYDTYESELKMSALASLGYSFAQDDKITYSLFYSRNAVDQYKRREGYDAEGVDLIGSNSVQHVYALLNNQLSGQHNLYSDVLKLYWSGSYGHTLSNEPDRRQVMFRDNGDEIKLFKLNKQETNRFYGYLTENEVIGDLKLEYSFGKELANSVKLGGSYKNKQRDYASINFYYNLTNIDPIITDGDIYNTDDYLNNENLANGTLTIIKDAQPRAEYYAGSTIASAFAELDYNIGSSLLLNLGLRFENSQQWVQYWDDAAIENLSELNKADLFPALNLKYSLNKNNAMRFAFSRTVTRPSFIEMAPFLYSESYGSAEIRGNADLMNGYNWNIDLRYEVFSESTTDMLSFTAYYKYLTTPIERVQESSGGSIVHSFRNAEDGTATGLEVELRKGIVENLNFGFNASYIYTNVVLPENGGIYTDTERELQGASPYLINADLTYSIKPKEESLISLALLYNLQGPRIHAVGIYEMSNVVQEEVHTLNFVANYNINQNWSVKAKLDNLLNTKYKYTQYVESTGINEIVELYKPGVGAQIGFTYNF